MHQSILNQAGKVVHLIQKSTDMTHILSHAKAGSLVIFDIDDTIGRVPQAIGLDPWFRFRIEQYKHEGHEASKALALAIEIYNLVQKASSKMVPVDQHIDIAALINQLKAQNTKVIALTARNYELTEKTLDFLKTLGVQLSDDVIKPGLCVFSERQIEIKDGVIFVNGANKGACLEYLLEQGYFLNALSSYEDVSFIDDSEKNCDAVAQSFNTLKLTKGFVWHYTYAETYLPFQALDKQRARIQEDHLLKQNVLLTDEEADAEQSELSTFSYSL